jgi:lipoprotein-anchoring transpeptidase ErfK/SrfK
MTGVRSATAMVIAFAIGTQVALTACDSSAPRSRPTPTATAHPVPPPPAAEVAVSPAIGAAGVPISTEIGTQVTHGKVAAVALVDEAGRGVLGELREDGSSWVPATALRNSTSYTATVTAVSADGKKVTRATTFTTMAKPTGGAISADLLLRDGATYGVGMPIVVQFDSEVPPDARAAVQRRLFVRSDPPQPGAWHWFGGRQVLYRPRSYWQPGTKIIAREALNGVQVGNRFAGDDFSASVVIGRKLTIDIDNATKRMSVYRDDALINSIPVSLGKASTPSSSGTTVIMEKDASTVFRTSEYTAWVQYAQRLTGGGQYIHSAPWSVADQGVRNVSHGCTNIAPGNAKWLFDQTLVGDPVTTRNTEVGLDPGDGWTAWDMSWSDYAQ